MKFLLLFIGLACCIIGIFLRKNAKHKIKGNIGLIVGALLITANLGSLWIGNDATIILISVFIITIYYKGQKYYKKDPADDDNMLWFFYSFILLAGMSFVIYTERFLPSVTLNNDAIEVGGRYSDIVKIFDIQSVDTVSVLPKILTKRDASLPVRYGNWYELQNETQRARLHIYQNKPPYIKIRMNDNSLFLLNFKEPEKTMEFYNRLKNELNK